MMHAVAQFAPLDHLDQNRGVAALIIQSGGQSVTSLPQREGPSPKLF